jgi:hypothetical protein
MIASGYFRRSDIWAAGKVITVNDEKRLFRTVLDDQETAGLGKIQILHPPGTFVLTPASLISIRAIGKNQGLLAGNGIDWGSGTGCLAIAAAKVGSVKRVVGLEIEPANVRIARENAALNGVAAKTEFLSSDSYNPPVPADQAKLDSLRGKADFVLANPPVSDDADGFEFRRMVLRGAKDYLRSHGRVFLSISYQYGMRRIIQLLADAPGFAYGGILATTDWVPFDLRRPDLLDCLRLYAESEQKGGLEYTFQAPGYVGEKIMNARVALAHFRATGDSPLSRWQTHLFERA